MNFCEHCGIKEEPNINYSYITKITLAGPKTNIKINLCPNCADAVITQMTVYFDSLRQFKAVISVEPREPEPKQEKKPKTIGGAWDR